jgi:hypothetical protein
MGTKPVSVSVSGYNASPPSDDGSVSEDNKVKWSGVKTKLGDPLKTAIEAISSGFVGSVGSVYARTSNTQITESNYDDTFVTTGTFSQTFSGAATLGANWRCYITNNGGTLTLTPNGSETINGLGSIRLYSGMGGMVVSDASNLFFVSGNPTSNHKIVSFTRDNTVANGTQAVTGVGFKPRGILFLASVSGTSAMSVGMTDGTDSHCIYDNNQNTSDTYGAVANQSVVALTANAQANYAALTSFDADGFTVTWTKVNSPTGTTTVYAICFM